MRTLTVLLVTFAALLSAPALMAQTAPAPGGPNAQAQSSSDDAKSEKEKKEARKARREHRKMVNHRIRRKH